VIYTPDNEPYLGLETVHAFDNLIVATMRANQLAAQVSQADDLSHLQRAASIIIPQGLSIALSIRELIRQGYLFGAQVLIRPLAERAITILYLAQNPNGLKIWTEGWSHKKRPPLAKMISLVSKGKFKGSDVTKKMNSLIHGDPLSSTFNLREYQDPDSGYSASKILNNPQLCSEVSLDASEWLGTLMGMMCRIFELSDGKLSGKDTV